MATIPQTRWWHADGDKVVCDLCPRECRIASGKRGFCFVRANEGGQMVLTTYGRSTGFCIDPIEKKPLNHFLPGTPVLSFGTAGCNLGCKFCQNWDISKSREIDRLSDLATPEAIVEAARQTGCRSIAFTYNDPTIWAEYAIDTARVARQAGIKTVAVTAGYISPGARDEFYQWMDAANVDLKAFTEHFYKYITLSHLEPVLDTLKWLKHHSSTWFEITNLMIPGENDSTDEIARMCDWLYDNLGPDVPVHFTAFHPDYKMMDKQRTPPEALLRARQQAMDRGLRYVYVGNVDDVRHQSTWCPQCGSILVERNWYELGRYGLNGNRCARCGFAVPGVFEDHPGDWGRKRLPVRIQSTSSPLVPLQVTRTMRGDGAVDSGQSAQESSQTMAQAQSAKSYSWSAGQQQALLDHVAALLETCVTSDAAPGNPSLDSQLVEQRVPGVFVTLLRHGDVRAQAGRHGSVQALGAWLSEIVAEAASEDRRHPAIAAHELELLTIELSFMHEPQRIDADGIDRIEEICVGQHGLILQHPDAAATATLLPQELTRHQWDGHTALEQLALQVGLPAYAWEDDAAELWRFECETLVRQPTAGELDARSLSAAVQQQLIELAGQLAQGLPEPAQVAADLQQVHPGQLGLYLYTASGGSGMALGSGHSLLELVRIATQSLKTMFDRNGGKVDPISRALILWQPLRLRAADHPHRHGGQLLHCAVLAHAGSKWGMSLPNMGGTHNRVGEALSAAQLTLQQWVADTDKIRLFAFNVTSFTTRSRAGSQGVRPPARAGQFYPADPEQMRREIESLLAEAEDMEPRRFRAVMLPHAGWKFCGSTLAKTISRVQVPDTVVIVGPKHTPFGADLSIPPHTHWQIPGARIPIATDFAQQLLQLLPQVTCESEAHRMEHGVEVILPFLHRLNPDLSVLPLVMGRMSYEATAAVARALGTLVTQSREPILLVISSDMNHFAPEAENRQLDEMALGAMFSGDPQELYQTCAENRISMCGVLPAVTVMQALQQYTPDLDLHLVDYSTSAKASGDTSSVVGYAGVVIE